MLFAIVLIFVIFVAPEGVAGGLARLLKRFVVVVDKPPTDLSRARTGTSTSTGTVTGDH